MEKFLAAKGFDHYGLFVQDYGGPVGFRIVGRQPQALDWLIIQNTNAYEEGFSPAWDGFRKALWVNRNAESEAPLAAFNTPDAIKSIVYLGGAGHPELIAPEATKADAASVAGPNNLRIQLDLFYDYRTNPQSYPVWQKFLRDNQPRTLIFWGQHDPFFTPAGRRSLSEGPAQGRNAPAERRPLRDRRQSSVHRKPHHRLLRQAGEGGEVAPPPRRRRRRGHPEINGIPMSRQSSSPARRAVSAATPPRRSPRPATACSPRSATRRPQP